MLSNLFSFFQLCHPPMTSTALFPFEMLTVHEFLKEQSEKTPSFNEYSDMYFYPRFPYDCLTQFAYNDKVE